MQTAYTLSEDLQYELQQFLNNHDIAMLNQNLRRLLVDFLDYELRTGVPLYFDGFFFPFNKLLDVLDIAARELQVHAVKEKLNAPPAPQPLTPTGKVIAFLVASLSPSAIFLLYDTIDDNNAYFDLLVIIPPASKTSFAYYEQVITMANIEDAIINVSLHKEEMLQQQLQEGHIYYSIACTKEKLVYTNNNFEFPQPNKETLKTLAAKATTAFNAAHKKADGFLHGACNYRADKDNEMTAFMLQQATELTLRGLITALLGSCAKTHCLRELKKPLKRCAPEIKYLFSPDAAEENRLLTLLEKAYLEARYSSLLVISDSDIDVLTEAAETLHEQAAGVFTGKISAISNGYN